MEPQNDSRIALLIDADNAQAELIVNMLAEAGKHGKVTIKFRRVTQIKSIKQIVKYQIMQGPYFLQGVLIV